MVLGAALLCAALTLLLVNQRQNSRAQLESDDAMAQLMEQIQANAQRETEPDLDADLLVPQELLTEDQVKMPDVTVEGNSYIGYLRMPTLGLNLPIQSTWSLAKLQIAPCRYTGSLIGRDLVLMAHNYKSHFGPIRRLKTGDELIFTDVEGTVTRFEVVGRDVLPPTAVEEMTCGEFPLTLFTCTYGGKTRMTVYCDIVED